MLYRSQETITAAWKRLNVDGSFGGLSEAVAKSFDGRIQGMVEIDESVLRPELPAQLLARDKFTRARNKRDQNLEGLLLKADFRPILTKLSRVDIHLKGAETENVRLIHERPPIIAEFNTYLKRL